MSIDARVLVLVLGMAAATYMLGMLLWSIARPERRTWPPQKATTALKLRVWVITITIFAAAFLLGVMDWNRFGWPAYSRWAIGVPLILIGNVAVWWGVNKIGYAATSGEASGLKTDGLYRWSRNPQYVADIVILIGWAVLAASLWALPVLTLGFGVLAIAPYAEEPWLEERYGQAYSDYRLVVRRYL
jgi:protein-S-isoprenylcysteine O-methyltransferase Ste14